MCTQCAFCVLCGVDNLLPVSLAGGINILESGQTWLAKHLTGRRVWFKPLRITTDDRLECIVYSRMVLFPASVYLCLCMYVSLYVPVQLYVCMYVCILRAIVQLTLDPYAEAFL